MTALFTSIPFEESTLTEYDTVTLVKWFLTLWRTAVHFQRVSRFKNNGFLNCTAMKISKLVSPHLMLHNFNSWYTQILIIEEGITSTLTIRNDKQNLEIQNCSSKWMETAVLCTTSCVCTCHHDFKNSFILATSELHKTNVDSYSPIKWLMYLNSIDAAL